MADGGPDGDVCRAALRDQVLVAPDLLRVEVLSVIRRHAASGALTRRQADNAVEDVLALPITVYPTAPLLHRCWALRNTVTAHDACYVALAEALGVALLTADAKLANAAGRSLPVQAHLTACHGRLPVLGARIVDVGAAAARPRPVVGLANPARVKRGGVRPCRADHRAHVLGAGRGAHIDRRAVTLPAVAGLVTDDRPAPARTHGAAHRCHAPAVWSGRCRVPLRERAEHRELGDPVAGADVLQARGIDRSSPDLRCGDAHDHILALGSALRAATAPTDPRGRGACQSPVRRRENGLCSFFVPGWDVLGSSRVLEGDGRRATARVPGGVRRPDRGDPVAAAACARGEVGRRGRQRRLLGGGGVRLGSLEAPVSASSTTWAWLRRS